MVVWLANLLLQRKSRAEAKIRWNDGARTNLSKQLLFLGRRISFFGLPTSRAENQKKEVRPWRVRLFLGYGYLFFWFFGKKKVVGTPPKSILSEMETRTESAGIQ